MDYFNMWKSAWNFQKRYAEVKPDDEYWQSVIDAGNDICKQYGNCKFIRDLILAVITEFERVVKQDAKAHNRI